MMDKSLFVFLFGLIFVIVGLIVCLVVPIYYLDKSRCKDYAELSNLVHYYSLSTGCLLMVEKEWVPIQNIYENTYKIRGLEK